jgi:hypothetical protein
MLNLVKRNTQTAIFQKKNIDFLVCTLTISKKGILALGEKGETSYGHMNKYGRKERGRA